MINAFSNITSPFLIKGDFKNVCFSTSNIIKLFETLFIILHSDFLNNKTLNRILILIDEDQCFKRTDRFIGFKAFRNK